MTSNEGGPGSQNLIESTAAKPSIVVLDPLKLRRSCIAHILAEWSRSEGLTINSVARVTPGSPPDINRNCRLFVISVGGKSVTDADVNHNIQVAKVLFPEVPILIVSDLDDQSEVFEAFRLGAKGYIPTSLDPKIALRACTFILGGGSYFPPSALAATNESESDHGTFAGHAVIAANPATTLPLDTGDWPAPPAAPQPVARGMITRTRVVAAAQSPEPSAPAPAPSGAEVAAGQSGMVLTERQGQVANLLKDGLPNKLIARHLGMTEATVKVHVRQIMRKLGVHNRTQVALSMSSLDAAPGSQTGGVDL